MKTIMCVQLGSDSAYVENPPIVPKIGSGVVIKLGAKRCGGFVVSVIYDYSVEDELFITVTAR